METLAFLAANAGGSSNFTSEVALTQLLLGVTGTTSWFRSAPAEVIGGALVLAIPIGWILLGVLLARWGEKNVRPIGRLLPKFAAGSLILAVIAAAFPILGVKLDVALIKFEYPLHLSMGIYCDQLTAVMLLLVNFIGAVVVRFAIRYLDGDPRQVRFYSWLAVTLGSAMLLIVSGNLLLLTLSWMLTSLGLHKLLIHQQERPAAQRAARKKFLISRIGDAFLLVALFLTYLEFGSFEYGEIFAAAKNFEQSLRPVPWYVSAISICFVLGAMTKSAQFPFHSWLPDTMETPTPVSALMHAGIINAGGYLVIRLNPLISLSHAALDFLTVVGAITALMAATIMLTQTSVKRSLAYSTIAQMGFMMLQCGIGAYTAAMLHIVAHSLYKAHTFLRAGTLPNSANRSPLGANLGTLNWSQALSNFLLSSTLGFAVTLATLAGFYWLDFVDLTKPGAWLQYWILSLAMVHLTTSSVLLGGWRMLPPAILRAALLAACYVIGLAWMGEVLQQSIPKVTATNSWFDFTLMLSVAIGFFILFVFQNSLLLPKSAYEQKSSLSLLDRFYVHATNGFYLDVLPQKLTDKIWNRIASSS